MAISKPPKRPEGNVSTQSSPAGQPTEAQIMAVINKGGSVPSEHSEPPSLPPAEDVKRGFELRLYQSMIDDIDTSRGRVKRGKKPSRNAWIVAAIEEKLAREK